MTNRPGRVLRLGTRTSPLAMAQAHAARASFAAAHPGLDVQIVGMESLGDLNQDKTFAEFPERGIFAGQLEAALLAGSVDIAVHSCKDLRLELPPELTIVAFMPREDPRDALCGPATSLDELPEGARIATGSTRRRAALRALRPDLRPVEIRGNVQTRLTRTVERGYDACMLAMAGLRRLGLESAVGYALDVRDCVPEAGQGAVAIQVATGSWASELDFTSVAHEPTHRAVEVERAAAALLGGGCTVPIGIHLALRDDGAANAFLFAASPDCEHSASGSCTVNAQDPVAIQAAAIVELARELDVLQWSELQQEPQTSP